MTTDTHYKECAVLTEIGGKQVHIGAMCKGSGMIHINLGTMLAFITTDCAISSKMLSEALEKSVEKNIQLCFNRRGHFYKRHAYHHGKRNGR